MAKWESYLGQYLLTAIVYVSGGEFDYNQAQTRYAIFQKELILALTVIVNGDKEFYCFFPCLFDCPIYVHHQSDLPDFNHHVYYGSPRQYRID
jgi:hypothetical protein